MARRKVNPDIGTCPCFTPGCHQTAKIRKERSGALYLWCPDCQRLAPNPRLNDYILEKGAIWGPDGVPLAGELVPAKPKSETKPAPPAKPTAHPSREVDKPPVSAWSRFWAWLWDWDL